MISPLVILNRRSWVISHRKEPCTRSGRLYSRIRKQPTMLGRPLNFAAGVFDRRSGLVARHNLVDAVQIFRIVLAVRLRLAHEGRCHELMIALAVVALVG